MDKEVLFACIMLMLLSVPVVIVALEHPNKVVRGLAWVVVVMLCMPATIRVWTFAVLS